MDVRPLRAALRSLPRAPRWSIALALLTGPTFGFYWFALFWLIVPATVAYLVHRTAVVDDPPAARPWATAVGVAAARWIVAAATAMAGVALGLGIALGDTPPAGSGSAVLALVGLSLAAGNLAGGWVAVGHLPGPPVAAALVIVGIAEVAIGFALYDALTGYGVVGWVVGFTVTVGVLEVLTWNLLAALVADRIRTRDGSAGQAEPS